MRECNLGRCDGAPHGGEDAARGQRLLYELESAAPYEVDSGWEMVLAPDRAQGQTRFAGA